MNVSRAYPIPETYQERVDREQSGVSNDESRIVPMKRSSLKALCVNCSSPLDSSSVRCLSCGHRHAMTNCLGCGDPIFKHAATRVVKKSWRELPSQGFILYNVLKWVRQPKYTHIFYLHSSCAESSPELLDGASSVATAKTEFLQQIGPDMGQLSVALNSHQSKQPLKLVGGTELNHQAETNPSTSAPEINLVDAFTELSRSKEQFNSFFGDESLGLPDVFSSYYSGERDFSKAQLEGLSLDGQSLFGIDLSRSDLRRVLWKNVHLPDVDLCGAIADYGRFENINFLGGLFRNSSFRDVSVILSNFTQADFYKADLRRSDFYSSNFHRATLTLANLTDAKLDATDLSLACLLLATLTQASLMEANLEGATLEQADLSSANLSWANLTNAVANHVNLSDAGLQHADLTGIDLTGAQLLGTDFLSSNIEAARSLEGATYNTFTRFPDGFKPEAHNMRKV